MTFGFDRELPMSGLLSAVGMLLFILMVYKLVLKG